MSGAVRSLNCHVQLWKINLDPLPSTTRKAWYRNNNIAFEKATPFRSFFFFFLSLFFISFQHALPRVATNTSPGKIKNYNISWHSLRTHYCTNISSKAKCSSSSTIVRKTNTSRMHSVEVGGKSGIGTFVKIIVGCERIRGGPRPRNIFLSPRLENDRPENLPRVLQPRQDQRTAVC